jgi:hypothetical protein
MLLRVTEYHIRVDPS